MAFTFLKNLYKSFASKIFNTPNTTMDVKSVDTSTGSVSSSSNGEAAPVSLCPAIFIPPSFRLQSVDSKIEPSLKAHVKAFSPALQATLGSSAPAVGAIPSSAVTNPPLGVLTNFYGDFTGHGMNLIFRPNNGTKFNTTFTNAVAGPPIPEPPNENVLELNLTSERLSFSNPLGEVPNRGLTNQSDIFLNGVPYVQTVSDVTNPATGKGDGPAAPIHFEPGLWMHVPATTNDPVNAESLVRMASIPHGTTINAQSLVLDAAKQSPTITLNGPPDFTKAPNVVDITPFFIPSGPKFRFASQTAASTNTPRLPQDLTRFIAAGSITQAILDNPNLVLQNAIKGQNITQTIVFKVSTTPTSPEQGGGVANIAFLQGTTLPQANASVPSMQATFWIETVEHKIVVPVFKLGQPPIKVSGSAPVGGEAPVFHLTPPKEILHPITITLHSTQIQYSQTVLLNFAGLTWPHVSVATLTPAAPLTVPASSPVWR
jgi:hypothetical protein